MDQLFRALASPGFILHPMPERLRQVIVGVADLKAAGSSDAVLITYALGSCLGVTCYDPVRRTGAMLHALLPEASACPRPDAPDGMFVDTGMQALAEQMLDQGSNPEHCVFKVFGGAAVIAASNFMDIGSRNVAQMRRLTLQHRWSVAAWEIGGQINRTIQFYLDNGDVVVRMPNRPDICV